MSSTGDYFIGVPLQFKGKVVSGQTTTVRNGDVSKSSHWRRIKEAWMGGVVVYGETGRGDKTIVQKTMHGDKVDTAEVLMC